MSLGRIGQKSGERRGSLCDVWSSLYRGEVDAPNLLLKLIDLGGSCLFLIRCKVTGREWYRGRFVVDLDLEFVRELVDV